jgi:hypothetical protein
MASVSVCLTFILLGWMPKSGKDRCSLASQDLWQNGLQDYIFAALTHIIT